MSFFILSSNRPFHEATRRFAAAIASDGFSSMREIDLGRYRLFLFGNLGGAAPCFHQAANGDFAAGLGSLIYRGRPAPTCLPDLLADFDADHFDWHDLIGTHVLLVRRRGVLSILGDGLGACKLYTDAQHRLWSNSFLAMLEIAAPKTLDVQACYEYVCNGSVFGRRTLVEDISALPANAILRIDSDWTVLQRPSPIENPPPPEDISPDDLADRHCAQLDAIFGPIARAYPDKIRLSFSGGFDSRLMLAMLLRHGARPTLFVYGAAADDDVRIARTVCDAERLELVCIDKDVTAPIEPEAFAETLGHDLVAFDGWKLEHGLFDFGVDRRDRLLRHRDGGVPMNGSLGEIYRNFFYMPDRASSTAAVISTFYSQFDPRAFTDRFVERAYRSRLAASMREAIATRSDRLQRSQVEELYPKFRGRFWTGRDAQVNQRFGTMFFPYLEHHAISGTARIPLRLKDLGRLQGRMIGRINPRLAAYPSDYGFALDGPRPWSYRMKSLLGTQRPSALRRLSFRLKHRTTEPRPATLQSEYLARVIDPDLPVMRQLFRPERVNSSQQLGLILTLEYLAARFGLSIPGV